MRLLTPRAVAQLVKEAFDPWRGLGLAGGERTASGRRGLRYPRQDAPPQAPVLWCPPHPRWRYLDNPPTLRTVDATANVLRLGRIGTVTPVRGAVEGKHGLRHLLFRRFL